MKGFRISTLFAAAAALWLVAAAPAFGQGSIGPLLEDDLVVSSGGEYLGRANVAFDGTNYLIVWPQDSGLGSGRDIYGRLASLTGEVSGPEFLVISTQRDDVAPVVAHNGT